MATRWSQENTRPQCPKCNLYGQGEQYIFGTKLNQSEKDLPTTFYAELDREDQSMKSNFFGQEHDCWPSGTNGWSKRSMHGMSAHTLKTIQQLRRLRHIALAKE